MKKLIKLTSLLSLFILTSCGEEKEIENFEPIVVDQSFEIEEHSSEGTLVGVVIAEDLNEGQELTFSIISGNDENIFNLDESTGEITIVDAFKLDAELQAFFEIEVAVSDNFVEPETTNANILIDVVDISPLNIGLIGHYPFDGDYVDISETANEANGFKDDFIEDRFDRIESAIRLNGGRFDPNYITIPNNSIYDFEGDFSISLWLSLDMEQTSGRSRSIILTKGTTLQGEGVVPFRLELNNDEDRSTMDKNEMVFYQFDGYNCGHNNGLPTSSSPKTGQLDTNSWYHLVLIRRENKISVYVNGTRTDRREVTIDESCRLDNINSISIGRDRGEFEFGFDGAVDDFLIFNRALEANEIVEIYKD